MPELPEVETIRRGLAAKILHQKISGLQLAKLRLLKNSPRQFKKILIANSFSSIKRRGKLLIFHLTKADYYLLMHLGMTGQLIYKDKQELIAGGHNLPRIENLPNKYSHIVFDFKGGAHLYFNDMRQFGRVQLVDKKNLDKILSRYGSEPMDKNFSWLDFKKITSGRKTKIKALFLDQRHLSGIGNIYADEICWQSRILPWRSIANIKERELKSLYRACRQILQKAVAQGGTTFSDYRRADGSQGGYRAYLKVYGREGKQCFRCAKVIRKKKVVGRGTHYCSYCQV